jgi:hypothetical protein
MLSIPLHGRARFLHPPRLHEYVWVCPNPFRPVIRRGHMAMVTRPGNIVHIRRSQFVVHSRFDRLREATPPINRQTRERLLTLIERTIVIALERSIHAQIAETTATALTPEWVMASPG